MRPPLLALLLALLAAAPAWAEPVLQSLLPQAAAPGTTVFVTGSGFGSDRAAVTVRFGEVPGKVIVVRDTSLGVNVPEGAPAHCDVTVEVAGQRSNGLPFRVGEATEAAPRVRVRLDVGKNPLSRGEETTGVFTVEGTEEPVRLHFVNSNPDAVEFVGGHDQTVTTTGGASNTYTFAIRGLAGQRLYRVAFDWKRPGAPEEAPEWKLPWGRVDVTAKPQPTRRQKQ